MRRFRGWMDSASEGGKVLVSSGLVAPVGPRRLVRMIIAGVQNGLTVYSAIAIGAQRWPDRPAVIDERTALTYGQLHRRCGALAAALRAHYGIRQGSKIGIMCRNHVGFVESVIAGSRLGSDLVFLNTDFAGPQLSDVLRRERIALVIHDEEFDGVLAQSDIRIQHVLAFAQNGGERPSIDSLVRAGGNELPRTPASGKIIILTSGTTGTPKGARRDIEPFAFLGPMTTMLSAMRLRSGEPMLILPPLFHGFGLIYLVLGLVLGCPVVLSGKFDPERALDLIDKRGVTALFGVPVMLQRILRLSRAQRRSERTRTLRVVGSAAAPLSAGLSADLTAEFGEIVFNLYGSTETGWATIATPRDLKAAQGTVGRPARGITVRVLDEEGLALPCGAVGRIFVGSRLMFTGYSGGGNKDVVDTLMSTGDLGHFDASGRLFVDGREDDMIVSGGENVFPQEVGDLLETHHAVEEASVIGVPDDEFGSRLAARVIPAEAHEITAEELRNYVKSHLARFKVPRDVEFVRDLPRTETGKVRRR